MNQGLANMLLSGGVAVIPTDTIYGVVVRATDAAAVEKVYALKGRAPEKPCIILIANEGDVAKFGITPTPAQEKYLKKIWPGPVTVLFSHHLGDEYEYLHRGKSELAFRLPDNESLRGLLERTGPLIAPSANPEGQRPAKTAVEAREYFGKKVDWYEDGGVLEGAPSSMVRILADGAPDIVRRGAGVELLD